MFERWLINIRASRLQRLLAGNRPPRKWRLLIAECCRRLGQEDIARLCEGLAEGQALEEESRLLRHRPWLTRFQREPRRYRPTRVPPTDQVREFMWLALHDDPHYAVSQMMDLGPALLQKGWAELIDDIFGESSDPAIDPRWLTSTVIDLARTIYDEIPGPESQVKMAILADALQDAGCDSETMLSHCRSGIGHIRGCWLLDAILCPASVDQRA